MDTSTSLDEAVPTGEIPIIGSWAADPAPLPRNRPPTPPPVRIVPPETATGPDAAGAPPRSSLADRPWTRADHEVERVDVTEVVRSDSAEFSEFYRNHWRGVARGLALTLGDADLASEATDEAMARAYPRWSTIRTYDNPAGWVYRVGLNWARSYHRRIARLIPFAHHDAVDLAPVADPAIREALLRLDIKQRSVVVCRLLLDWSVDETAAALEISPGTVKSRLHRALHILESTLADHKVTEP
jgi:RNA polymerase sigma-70 factor (ECF subfamily)